MPLHRVAIPLVLGALLASACGGPKEYPIADGGLGGYGGSTSVSSSSSSGSVPTGICGNAIAEQGEQCDGSDLFGNTCATVGKDFNAGTLACTKSCLFDTAGCTVVEGSCFDGADADQNGLADCADSACAAACAAACAEAAIQVIPDQSTTFAVNAGHPSDVAASCAAATPGPALVFAVTPTLSGVLDLAVESGEDLTLSARKTCADAAAELGCFDRFLGPGTVQRLKVPCTAGETVYVVVQGHGPTDAGPFNLLVANRAVTCGDGFTDGAEACDDGNKTGGDGCSATCALELTEVEPNDTAAQANAYTSPWFGALTPAGDVDTVAITVPSAPALISAAVRDLDGHACAAGGLEGRLAILAPDGATEIAARDAGATDTCPSTHAGVTAPGTYYVRLAASTNALTPTFAYGLDVTVKPVICGDGQLDPPEQCDDGNTLPGDGCDAACQREPTEIEPNNTVATANAYQSPWYGDISPAGDADVIAFPVPAGASWVSLVIGDNGDGSCASNTIISEVELIAPDGVTVLGSDHGSTQSYCAFLLVANTAQSTPIHAGTYYARVRGGPALPSATFSYTLAIDAQ